jgi:galactokinase
MVPPIEDPQSREQRLTLLKEHFVRHFEVDSKQPLFLVSVPLRVAPLGAHSDHQGGRVTGLTIDRSIDLLGQFRSRPAASVVSVNFNQRCDVTFESVPDRVPGEWGNYLRGAVQAMQRASGPVEHGFNGVMHGAMPIGGLSSSAAVTIAYLKALQRVCHRSLSELELIMLVRAVENGYLGLHSGILDQSVILSSRKNSLTVINCSDHSIHTVSQPRCESPWEIMVVYSGLSRQLTGTPFNQRVDECHEAARELLSLCGRAMSERPLLGDLSADDFARFESRLSAVSQKRARHFFSEAARVRRGVELWRDGDMEGFGRLVTESGNSSIVNYESGSPALISLYEILAQISGVYGTRFCGGGFQGCCLAIIDPRKRVAIAEELHAQYCKRHPELESHYSIHFCHSVDSVSVEDL